MCAAWVPLMITRARARVAAAVADGATKAFVYQTNNVDVERATVVMIAQMVVYEIVCMCVCVCMVYTNIRIAGDCWVLGGIICQLGLINFARHLLQIVYPHEPL